MLLPPSIFPPTTIVCRDSDKEDPYCRLAILDRRHQDSPAVKKGNIADWETAGIVVGPAQETSVKQVTLEPTWDEELTL